VRYFAQYECLCVDVVDLCTRLFREKMATQIQRSAKFGLDKWLRK
jgi:hypothetical protein